MKRKSGTMVFAKKMVRNGIILILPQVVKKASKLVTKFFGLIMTSGVSMEPTVINTNLRKSIKKHQCCECKFTIQKGMQYYQTTGLWEGEWFEFKQCFECYQVFDALTDYAYASRYHDEECYPSFSGIEQFLCDEGSNWEAEFGSPEFVELMSGMVSISKISLNSFFCRLNNYKYKTQSCESEDYPPCVICGGENDIGEICKKCADENILPTDRPEGYDNDLKYEHLD